MHAPHHHVLRRSGTRALVLLVAMATPAVVRSQTDCSGALFLRGDVDGDARFRVGDVILVFSFLFRSGGAPSCMDAADANDDGGIDISDGVFLLGHLFLGSAPPPPPRVDCGADPTPDALGCATYPPCDGERDQRTSSDPENCGECGRRCSDLSWPRVATYTCRDGVCGVRSCEDGFLDVDGLPETGCETPLPPGVVNCDDGNPCTVNDVEIGGICGGAPINCSHLSDLCGEGVCDGETGECVKRARNLDFPCDDGDPRTTADRCMPDAECRGIRFR